MDNPLFIDNENAPPVSHHDEDCNNDNDNHNDDNDTPNTSRADETTITIRGSTDKQATSTLWLREIVKRDTLAALSKHVADDLNLTLFRIGFFRAAHGWGVSFLAPLP